MSEVLEEIANRVDIFIWENSYKESKRKVIISKENKKKTHSLILRHGIPELEVELQVMNKYYAMKTDQHGIYLANIIWTLYHLHDDDKQNIMAAVETDNPIYIFYQYPYKSKTDYLEAFKSHLKVI